MQRLARTMIRMDSSWHERRPRPSLDDGMRFIELRDATLRVRIAGEGDRTLVIAPDPPNMIEHYTELIPRLAREFRVICFEPPGFGFSTPRTHFAFSVSEHADVVIDLLDTLRVRDVVLSLPCLAAFTALLVAKRRPDLVNRLVLQQAPSVEALREWTRQEDYMRIIATPGVGQLALALGKRMVARQWYNTACSTPAETERFLRPTLDAFERGASFCLASQFQAFQRGREDYSGVTQDIIVMWGAGDPTHRTTDGHSLLERHPHARHVEIPGCSHFPDLERPDLYLRCLAGVSMP